MKTLILNGSPRINGDTAVLIKEFTKHIEGEYKTVDVFDSNIKSCIDCRFCRDHDGCSQKDEMQEVYHYIQECDNVLIASPIFFTELTGQLLVVASRLQTYYCARNMRNETAIKKSKKGAIILVAGGNEKMEKAADTAAVILKEMNVLEIAPVLHCLNTDNISPEDNVQAMEQIKEIAKFFNERKNNYDKRTTL